MTQETDFYQQLRERYTYGLQCDAKDRERAQEDVKFANGEQWDKNVRRARKKRPVLTENRLGPSINQVVNEGRQNKPAILTVPMDNGTPETAEYYQGRIRHIEYECDADEAYDTARRQQVTSGRGFIRVATKYAKAKGKRKKAGEQEICIEPIHNQFSVIWDPDAKRYDKSDARWMFVVRPPMSREAYEAEFGKETEASKRGFFEGMDNPAPGWVGIGSDGRSIQLADYYYIDDDDVVKICCTNGIENLDETEWIGSTIPIIPLFGEQDVVEGEIRHYSLVHFAKDPQRLVNLYVSNIAEQIAQMPKSPYLVAEGSIKGREAEWETINDVQRAVAQYKAFIDGQPVPPPQRNNAEPPIQALVQGYLQAVDAVKASMGIFDAALGARSNETSGLAIENRQKESDATNFHFSDNEARSRKRLGRILLEILPIIDGVEPAMKPVRTLDGKTQMAPINQEYTHPKTGQPVIHDMSADADYGIAIKTGPSYDSQREQEADRQGQLIQAVPDLMWVFGDLYFRNSDTPGSEVIADRMERAIAMRAPGLIDGGQDAQKQLGMAKAQVAQLGQQNQLLTGEVHKLAGMLESKAAENASKERIAAAELSSKERMKAMEVWGDVRAAEVKAKLTIGIADADREGARLEGMFDRAHEAALGAAEHVREMQAADAQRQHEQQIQASQQQAAADQQQNQQDHAADMQDAAAQQQRQLQQDQQQAQQQQQPAGAPAANVYRGGPMRAGHVVSIKGKRHKVTKVYPDKSFDAEAAA